MCNDVWLVIIIVMFLVVNHFYFVWDICTRNLKCILSCFKNDQRLSHRIPLTGYEFVNLRNWQEFKCPSGSKNGIFNQIHIYIEFKSEVWFVLRLYWTGHIPEVYKWYRPLGPSLTPSLLGTHGSLRSSPH